MTISRRSFLSSSSAGASLFLVRGSIAGVIGSTSAVWAKGGHGFDGYGDLIPDPNGLLDLPEGFQYRVFSREGDTLSRGGTVPSSHDGMAAFPTSGGRTLLVRNHELEPDDIIEDGLHPVSHRPEHTYDPEAFGGTTTLLVGRNRELIRDWVSLSGTSNNCAGGPTPWKTWLSCEETLDTIGRPHGYVFEVDPVRGGNPEPIKAMGRFEHEAVSFDKDGTAFLTEDADSPFGCFYRFRPNKRKGGRGSLHAGGKLAAMKVVGVNTDLSIVQDAGAKFRVRWAEIPNSDPADNETQVREQAHTLGATQIQKCEGTWCGKDGSIWFVASYGGGPDAEDEEDRSAAVHSGQIWKYDPKKDTLELVVLFPKGTQFDSPDNITVGPHGFALACTDGEDDQWLVGITEDGKTFPFALNALNEEEFAGATFSPDGDTLFVNIQGPPGLTLAIWGPWNRRGRGNGR